jgi:hypothetical protein
VAEFPYFEPFLGILEYGQYEGQFPDRDFVWYEVAYPTVLNFLQGNATLEETLQTIESEVQGSSSSFLASPHGARRRTADFTKGATRRLLPCGHFPLVLYMTFGDLPPAVGMHWHF